jgi:hypothetical protein
VLFSVRNVQGFTGWRHDDMTVVNPFPDHSKYGKGDGRVRYNDSNLIQINGAKWRSCWGMGWPQWYQVESMFIVVSNNLGLGCGITP